MTTLQSTEGRRLHGLDAVRGFAFLVTVTFHAALSFLPGPQVWVTRDTPNMGIAGFFVVSHMSHMLIFFLLAGFFARMTIERRGVGPFVKDRLLRITLPGIVFWPFAMAGIIATFVWGAITMHAGGGLPAAPKPPGFSAATFPLTHLWFLYALTLAYAGALAFVGLGKLLDRKGAMRARVYDPAMRFLVQTRLLVPVLALPMAILFFTTPSWLPAMGIPTPDTGFVPNVIAARSYALAFLVGWILQRQQGLLDLIRRDGLGYCLAAAVTSGLLLIQIKPGQFFAPVTAFAHPAQLAVLYALSAWFWTIGLIGAGLRYLNGDNRVVRYVSDASYWIYIAHLPVVMAAQVLVYRVQAPALVKFSMVTVGSFGVLFASYHLLVRHSLLGAWLNGRKVPWGKRRDSATLAAKTGKTLEGVAAWTDPTASAARDDLAFVRALVSDSGQVQGSTGLSLFGGGLCYGFQCVAQGLLLQFPAEFPGRRWAQLIFAVLPTVVFMVLVARITVRDIRDKPSAGSGVASRAFRTAFSAAGLSITVTATVFGYVAITEHNLTIWLFHPIMVCVALGVGWYMAYAIRRRPWFAWVSGGWFVCAPVLATQLHNTAAFIVVLGIALFGLMALPGWRLWRSARAGD